MSRIRFTTKAIPIALASLFLALGASAPTGAMAAGTPAATADAKPASTTLSRGDRKFMEAAATDGLAEVQFGELAASKAASADVKKFAQRMVDDHSKANDRLKQLAGNKGITLPTDLDAKHRRDHERLSKLSGADFDREYMKMMVSEHRKDVSEFKSQARSAKDADVRQFASSTLPTLEDHLRMAQTTENAVTSASRGGGMTKSGSAGPAPSSGAPGTSSSVTGGTGKATGAGTATAQSGSTTGK